MALAVALHVGSLSPLAEILLDLQNITVAGYQFDLFVNVIEDLDTEKVEELVKTSFPLAKVIVSDNRGMDIGGLFKLLPLIYEGKYTFLLKLHTKSMTYWRRQLISPLCGSPIAVSRALAQFAINPKVGLLGCMSWRAIESPFKKPNHYYLQKVCEKLKLPYGKAGIPFIGGTMFYIRMSILETHLPITILEDLRKEMNTPNTLDPHWYMVNYRDLNFTKPEQAEKHYEEIGKAKGRCCNCLDARVKGVLKYVPDGMIEHAYERLFGLLTQVSGNLIQGI